MLAGKERSKEEESTEQGQGPWGKLLRVNPSKADVVFMFLTPRLMGKLKQKVLEGMKPGGIVASYDHRFEGWLPEPVDGELDVCLHRLPLREVPGHEGETACTSEEE